MFLQAESIISVSNYRYIFINKYIVMSIFYDRLLYTGQFVGEQYNVKTCFENTDIYFNCLD